MGWVMACGVAVGAGGWAVVPVPSQVVWLCTLGVWVANLVQPSCSRALTMFGVAT